MSAINATWTNGRILLTEPADWPEGSQLRVEPIKTPEKIGLVYSKVMGEGTNCRPLLVVRQPPREVLAVYPSKCPRDGD